jgi:transcriptional regulator GlxA family with amidase domain
MEKRLRPFHHAGFESDVIFQQVLKKTTGKFCSSTIGTGLPAKRDRPNDGPGSPLTTSPAVGGGLLGFDDGNSYVRVGIMSKNRASAALSVPEHVSFLIVPRFNMATLITLIEPMRVANYLSAHPLYQWDIVSMDGDRVPASNGLGVDASLPSDTLRRGDLVFVLASWGAETYGNRATLAWLRRQARAGAQICSVENGCYLVARAGLLVGQLTAVHWAWAPGFQEQFADIPVVDQIFTNASAVMSCAGGTTGIDLMLERIAQTHGPVLAAEVADQMLHPTIRPAETPQRRPPGQGDAGVALLLRRAVALIEQNISEPLSVPQLAAALGTSQRQLERQFRHAIGCTVVQFGALCRLQHARVLLISTTLGVRDIAAASGFNSLSHFAHAFGACFGRKPSDYRQGWPSQDSAPTWPGTLAAFLETLHQRRLATLRQRLE